MKLTCQMLMAALLLYSFFRAAHADFEGGPTGGFKGFIVTVIVSVALFFVFLGAGCFSEFIGR